METHRTWMSSPEQEAADAGEVLAASLDERDEAIHKILLDTHTRLVKEFGILGFCAHVFNDKGELLVQSGGTEPYLTILLAFRQIAVRIVGVSSSLVKSLNQTVTNIVMEQILSVAMGDKPGSDMPVGLSSILTSFIMDEEEDEDDDDLDLDEEDEEEDDDWEIAAEEDE